MLGERIADLRRKAGLSQEDLAAKMGVSRQAVSKWEADQALPELDRIVEMSELFVVSTDYLLKGTALPAAGQAVPSASADSDGSAAAAGLAGDGRLTAGQVADYSAWCRKARTRTAVAAFLIALGVLFPFAYSWGAVAYGGMGLGEALFAVIIYSVPPIIVGVLVLVMGTAKGKALADLAKVGKPTAQAEELIRQVLEEGEKAARGYMIAGAALCVVAVAVCVVGLADSGIMLPVILPVVGALLLSAGIGLLASALACRRNLEPLKG